jgi:hypothetical protein
MNDENIAGRIEQLVGEEHVLRTREENDSTNGEALAGDRERLAKVGVQLDRCWDLLRQRRARRNAGGDPDDTGVRDASTVEGYLQ